MADIVDTGSFNTLVIAAKAADNGEREHMAIVNYNQTGKYLPPNIVIAGMSFVPGITEVSAEQLIEIRQAIKNDSLLQHYLKQKILILRESINSTSLKG